MAYVYVSMCVCAYVRVCKCHSMYMYACVCVSICMPVRIGQHASHFSCLSVYVSRCVCVNHTKIPYKCTSIHNSSCSPDTTLFFCV